MFLHIIPPTRKYEQRVLFFKIVFPIIFWGEKKFLFLFLVHLIIRWTLYLLQWLYSSRILFRLTASGQSHTNVWKSFKFAHLRTESSAMAFQQLNVAQSSFCQTTGFVILPFRRIFSSVFEKIMRSFNCSEKPNPDKNSVTEVSCYWALKQISLACINHSLLLFLCWWNTSTSFQPTVPGRASILEDQEVSATGVCFAKIFLWCFPGAAVVSV